MLALPEDRVPLPAYFSVNTEYAQKLADVDAMPPFSYAIIGFYNPTDKPAILGEQYTLVASWYPRDKSERIDELLANPTNPFAATHAATQLGPHIEIFRRVE